MAYSKPEIIPTKIEQQEVSYDNDKASGCQSSCCFTRESSSW